MGSDNYDFSLISLNVRGLNEEKKRKSIFNWARKQNSDLVFLQETYSSREVEHIWANQWGGRVFFAHGSNHSRGVMILLKNGLDCEVEEKHADLDGRYIILKASVQDVSFMLINIYAPNQESQQIRFYKDLFQLLQNEGIHNDCKIIMGGDFNIIMQTSLDKQGGNIALKEKSLEQVDKIMSDLDLQDIWRVKNPDRKRYTWRQNRPRIQCRLDYWIISDQLHDSVDNVDILPSIRSDHSAIYLKLKTTEGDQRGKGYWKLNVSLLQEEDYVKGMVENFAKWMEEYIEIKDKRVKWEIMKYNIRKFSRKYSKKKAEERKDKQNELQTNLKLAEEELDGGFSEEKQAQYESIKRELEELDSRITEGLIVRSRIRWHEEGEKSTSYFFNLERRNFARKHIKKLKIGDNIITEAQRILQEEKEFYTELYSATKIDLENEEANYFFSQNIPKLSEEQSNQCEGQIDFKECEAILKTFKLNKSPGNDGLTIEFYIKFWEYIGQCLIESFNYSYAHGELSTSQKQAVITLLDKKGKDRLYLKNWRPISLLNVDYKIVSKVLTLRLKPLLPHIIHYNQTGYVEGRLIGDALRTVLDTLEFTDRENIPGILLCIDFQKAFDSIEWAYIMKVLDLFNFGPSFKKWIKILYSNISSCVINNGITSGYFNLGRGVRQGDPLSPYLFILCVEILNIAIRNENDIKGITVGDEEIKLVQYADDMTALLSDIKSAKNLLKIIEMFGSCSGLKINTEKTEALWMGSMKYSNRKPLNISWPNGSVRLLGIYIGYDKRKTNQDNFDQKIVNLEKTYNIWRTRGLTLTGKILLAKTLGFSKFLYLASVITIPEEIVQRIISLTFKFIWGNSVDKVKRDLMYKSFALGGQNMMDFRAMQKALHIKWLQRYLDSKWASWKSIFKHFAKKWGDGFLLSCNFDKKELREGFSEFYFNALCCWNEIMHEDLESPASLGNLYVWNNKNIKINGHTVFCKELMQAGLWSIRDIYNDNRELVSFEVWKDRGVPSKLNLTYLGIISAIPQQWKKVVKQNIVYIKDELGSDLGTAINLEGILYPITTCKSKIFYNKLLSKVSVVTKAKIKYTRMFNIQEERWKNIYLLPRKTVISNKVKDFQYKILQRYLCTNVLLHKIGIKQDSKCSLCNIHEETIEHLLYHCGISTLFWNGLKEWWEKRFGERININLEIILFGKETDAENDLINWFLLYGKSYLYKCRVECKNPCLVAFFNYIKSVYTIEERLAYKSKTFNRFTIKWKHINLEDLKYII